MVQEERSRLNAEPSEPTVPSGRINVTQTHCSKINRKLNAILTDTNRDLYIKEIKKSPWEADGLKLVCFLDSIKCEIVPFVPFQQLHKYSRFRLRHKRVAHSSGKKKM